MICGFVYFGTIDNFPYSSFGVVLCPDDDLENRRRISFGDPKKRISGRKMSLYKCMYRYIKKEKTTVQRIASGDRLVL